MSRFTVVTAIRDNHHKLCRSMTFAGLAALNKVS